MSCFIYLSDIYLSDIYLPDIYLPDIHLKSEKYTTALNIQAFGNLKNNSNAGSNDFTSDENISEHFLGAVTKLRKETISFVMSVRPSAWNNSASTGLICMSFDI
jgi:hypothetical protein